MNQTLRRALATSTALALVAAAGPAAALGLGQIQVKSHPGQPLLAEIPIVSSDPAELQGLQVQLASPDTFRRIGLDPPQGDVSALHFEPAIDDRGRPVIRVTSPTPVQQPLLTFLVEVDWGGGRLVREYSALVDMPRTVAAPAQPPIEAPVVAAPNVVSPAVVTPPATAAAPVATPPAQTATPPPTPVPQPAPAAPAPVAEQPAAPPVPAPVPHPVAHPSPAHVAEAPKPTASPSPATAPARTPAANGSYQVRNGDTLAGIAAGMQQGDSLDQAMLALLRANPDAFVDGNINRLKAGAVLRTPTSDELSRISATEAAALVHEQISGWRQARKPVVQPAAAGAPVAAATPTPRPTPAVRRDEARLEIAPPAPGRARQAGTRSGLVAGGEGDMLQQQLQETKETLAARDAEVRELKSRVAELEKIQQDQQQLLQMKNSALAAAQQNLAKANAAPATPVAPTHAQATTPAPQAASAHAAGPWLWSGIGLVVLAAVGWWFTRRRQAPAAAPARRFDAATLAASVPPAEEPTVADYAVAARREIAERNAQRAAERAASPAVAPAPSMAASAPSWVAPGANLESPIEADALPADDTGPRSAAEQLDLAQAYLDVGDEEAARTLLREILDGRDPVAREAAARLLREL